MPEMTIDFSVYCSCGEGLCRLTAVKQDRTGISVIVDPCPRCLKLSYEDGYEDSQKEIVDNS